MLVMLDHLSATPLACLGLATQTCSTDGRVCAYNIQLTGVGNFADYACFGAAEARKKDIPIVQLNPGGTLNHKYTGETAVRGSGLPYSVLRSTGINLAC